MTDDKNLVPATDEEIQKAIDEVLDEMDDEIKAIFEEKYTEEEKAMMDEFEKAETIEERTAVMKKYKLGQYADNADEEFEGVYFID